MKDIPAKLRALRLQAGLSQKQAGEKAKIGWKTVSSYESGARLSSMKLTHLVALCRAYGTSPASFFGLDEEDVTTSSLQNEFFDLLDAAFHLPEQQQKSVLVAFQAVLATARMAAQEVRHIPVDPLAEVHELRQAS